MRFIEVLLETEKCFWREKVYSWLFVCSEEVEEIDRKNECKFRGFKLRGFSGGGVLSGQLVS